MEELTFALALVLGMGFLGAKLAQLIRLPSVTGYICAGLALGPSGLNLISRGMIDERLGHFTQIALMLIAFGVGEHLEFKKLRNTFRNVGLIGLFEGLFSLIAVASGIFTILLFSNSARDALAVALILGAVSIATAPASTMHVIRETRASGPLTTTLLQVVAIDNGLAIMLFGVTVSLVSNLLSAHNGGMLVPLFTVLLASLLEIGASLLLGIITGFLIDIMVNRLRERSEMLIGGLALLLLCGEAARILNYSPLLAGMAAGFTIVNRDIRDVRLFRALNSFEPPILVLFFALAGAHLDLSSLAAAGWLGAGYFLFRAGGKYLGAEIGARLASTADVVRKSLGLALFPQAGIAIGLVFLIREYPGMEQFGQIITPVVLAGVFISELVGPVCARAALEKAGETVNLPDSPFFQGDNVQRDICPIPGNHEEIQLIPWTWERLQPEDSPEGAVIFGVSHSETVAGLTRMATILAHHHHAIPVALNVLPVVPSVDHLERLEETRELFSRAIEEALGLGYRLETTTTNAAQVSLGIIEAASLNNSRAILLGHPLTGSAQEFQRVVDRVAAASTCPVMVVRFMGVLHTERILVPLTGLEELAILREVLTAMASVGRHQITLFYLLPPESTEENREKNRERLNNWIAGSAIRGSVNCRIITAEARLEAIEQETEFHDLLIMAAPASQGLKRLFFGSLAESVARRSRRSVIMVHGPGRQKDSALRTQ